VGASTSPPDHGPRIRPPIVMMVTDRSRTGASGNAAVTIDALVAAIGRAARAGVDLVQIRERDLEGGGLLHLAAGALAAVAGTGTRILINDRVDVALAARAHGVHLPARGIAASRLRTIAPPSMLVGRSVHAVDEALAAERDGGCDYLIFGTVFASAVKPAGHIISGVDALADVCRAVRLPVLAIGGITIDRAAAAAAAGAAGVAAITLFAQAEEAELRTRVRGARAAFRRD
jgi:thiamine-phosphate diphosphorylase